MTHSTLGPCDGTTVSHRAESRVVAKPLPWDSKSFPLGLSSSDMYQISTKAQSPHHSSQASLPISLTSPSNHSPLPHSASFKYLLKYHLILRSLLTLQKKISPSPALVSSISASAVSIISITTNVLHIYICIMCLPFHEKVSASLNWFCSLMNSEYLVLFLAHSRCSVNLRDIRNASNAAN